MVMGLLSVLLSLFCLSLLAAAEAGRCSEQLNCSTCVKSLSRFGVCVWCPLTKTCHEPGSVLSVCSFSQSVSEQEVCDDQTLQDQDYIPAQAHQMVMFSAVAYSDQASVYLSKAMPQLKFQSVHQVSRSCYFEGVNADYMCSGYTAVSHDAQIIVVAFRGTEKFTQLIDELKTFHHPMRPFPAGGLVQPYFHNAFYRVWDQLRSTVYNFTAKYPQYKVYVTGHSLGGALASIAAASIVHDRATNPHNTILYSFGEPRVGDYDYARAHDQLVGASWRVVHRGDIVVHLPPCKTTIPGFTRCKQVAGKPYHHGIEIFYPGDMTQGSSYRKCQGSPRDEDYDCSNALCRELKCFSIPDHKEYFNVDVGNWWMHV